LKKKNGGKREGELAMGGNNREQKQVLSHVKKIRTTEKGTEIWSSKRVQGAGGKQC